jgi:hypothetical protein
MNRGRHDLTVEDAAAAVVAARRDLTAATRRVDAAEQALRERQPDPADRLRADRAKQDRQLAEEAHQLALDRLRQALVEDRSRAPLVGDAAEWLTKYLASKGGSDERRAVKAAGHQAGHSEDSLRRAQERLKLVEARRGYPRRIWWSLPADR